MSRSVCFSFLLLGLACPVVDGYVSAAPSAFRSAGEAKATEGSESAAAAAVVGPQMARLGHKEGRKKPAVEAMERKAHK